MKRFINILILAAAFFLFTQGDGCSGGSSRREDLEQRRHQSIKDSIQLSLGASVPSKTTLLALDAAAITGFSDFSDYLKILGDTEKDSVFRMQAARMIREQFITGSCLKLASGYNATVNEITESPLLLPTSPLGNLDSIWIIKGLRKSSDMLYAGQLGFSITGSSNKNETTIQGKPGNADYYAVRKLKIFGTDSISTWSVRLGDIVIP